jgi:PAS domain S-box-containing protein
MGIVEDITERKRAEENLARLNRTLQTLYQCNQALVHATEEYELLQSVCQILGEVGGLRMAWVGYRERNAEKTVRPVAQAGYEEGYLERVNVTWADTERGRGPTGTAIRTGKACWTNNVQTDPKFALWRARALERGYASTIALPLMSDGEPFGALSLYAEEPDAFNEHTLEQFTELANNLAYGVMALRTREDRKRAEEALRESERQFRALFDEAAIGMALVNAVGHSLESNRKLQQMLGYSADELRQMPFTKVTHPDDVPPDWNLFMELVSGRRDQYQIDKRYYRKDGRLVWGSLTMSLVRDERGEPMFAIAMVEDITERKRAEEALRQTQAALAHLSRVMTMGELTASIAHEVNQPLAGVITNGNACLRWLAREAPDLEEARAAVERIIRDGNRASEVIRRIRALAKKTDPQTAWLDVNDVIHEVGALVQSEVRKHRVLLRMALSTALPPLLGDRVQLQQVVLNLIINGIEAMSSVADRPRELLIQSGTQGSSGIFVAVRDSGIGLDPQHLARLFDAFFTTKPGGMGMGLSISRTIIEAHGGQLWATPNEGHGATFRFTLPTGGERVS